MKYIIKTGLVLYVLLGFIVCTVWADDKLHKPFCIIPEPQKVELLEGNGLKFWELKYLKLDGDFERPVMGNILSNIIVPSKGSSGGTLILKLDSTSIVPASGEGYLLVISNGNVEITSRGESGLFYGCQTLEQLLEDARDFYVPIPSCRITDWPEMNYRAVHFDVKHHLDHMNYYYESIDRLARYKINAVIFEFEDKLRYQRQALVAAPQAISIDEMAALTNYARERHIEISPLVQGLGHATFILKHQEYANLRELPHNRWAFCPLKEGTYQVLFDLYRDAMEATPGSKYLHVGGDEIGNIGLCPRCKPTADKEGMLKLNLYWLKRVCEFAEENGRIPIFWDDMLLKEAGVYETTRGEQYSLEEVTKIWEIGKVKLAKAISDFPKNCVYMRWNYSMARQPGNIMALDWYRKNGFKVMAATATQSGAATLFPYDDRDNKIISRGTSAIRSFIKLGVEKDTEGMLCTAWDDKALHFETYWHGFTVSAEYSWSSGKRSLKRLDEAWLQREFGTSMPDYVILYNKLRKANSYWDSAFIRKGSRTDLENALFNLPGLAHWMPPKNPDTPLITDFSDILIDLPNKQNQGKWEEKYAERLKEANHILEDYQYTSKTLKELQNKSKRSMHHWAVFSALNDFQITAPKLMLAIAAYDRGPSKSREGEIVQIEKALVEFERAWENLNEVYSKTRFIKYPREYVPDRYFHYASQREDLSWMIQVEELLHEKVKQRIQLLTDN